MIARPPSHRPTLSTLVAAAGILVGIVAFVYSLTRTFNVSPALMVAYRAFPLAAIAGNVSPSPAAMLGQPAAYPPLI